MAEAAEDVPGMVGLALDGLGGAAQVATESLLATWPAGDLAWVHLARDTPDAGRWLTDVVGLDELVAEVLLEEETRPRCVPIDDGLLILLRGVNLNPGAEPEDMVSLRVWIQPGRIISVDDPRLRAVHDVRLQLQSGEGPTDEGSFLIQLLGSMTGRMGPVIEDLADGLDEVEEGLLDGDSREQRGRLADLRREMILLRRHLAPQREALGDLQGAPAAWLDEDQRTAIGELDDRVVHFLEDLEALREHAILTYEEITDRVSDEINRRMYALSLMAAVFLPLTLLTGLLGINVGGIPGANHPMAFTMVCVLMLGVAVLQVWAFRRLRWF